MVSAPLGVRDRHLPPRAVHFWWRGHDFFYVNMTYFLRDDDDAEYRVVRVPEGAIDDMVAASDANSSEVSVYPREGQSTQQRDRDRDECDLWSVDETGYDPAGERQDFRLASNYRRALTACLEGRGHTVR